MSFLSLPVEGDIIRGRSTVEQFPIEVITPLFEAVLSDENVARFGWTQYTPYFNDGDPCYFGVGELWADPAASESEDDYYYRQEGFTYDKRWGDYNSVWSPDKREWVTTYTEQPYPEAYQKLDELTKAIQSGHYDDALLEKFGDHAEITITRDKITVEYYEHD